MILDKQAWLCSVRARPVEEPEGAGGWLGPKQRLADEHGVPGSGGGGCQRPPPAPGMASTAQPLGMMREWLFSHSK